MENLKITIRLLLYTALILAVNYSIVNAIATSIMVDLGVMIFMITIALSAFQLALYKILIEENKV
jgi:hypothetical protein